MTSTTARRRVSIARVNARGEEHRIVRVSGNLIVCSKKTGSCCCGWEDKGRMPFDNDQLWGNEWVRRRLSGRVHLTFAGCLGPCPTGNNALLQIMGTSIWLKDLNEPQLAGKVYDWIEAMLGAGKVLPVPAELAGHINDRYLTGGEAPSSARDLEGLDPVCFMKADPASAKYTADHEGRTWGFCANSCRERFVADPAFFLMSENERNNGGSTMANAKGQMLDPICDMIVDVAEARDNGLTLEMGAREYAFCAAGCQAKFAKSPQAYIPKVETWLAAQG